MLEVFTSLVGDMSGLSGLMLWPWHSGVAQSGQMQTSGAGTADRSIELTEEPPSALSITPLLPDPAAAAVTPVPEQA